MAERPLLALPQPRRIDPPPGPRGGSRPNLPTKDSQLVRFGPDFRRLREVLARGGADTLNLRDDPTSLAPDRVVVFEIAGAVSDFTKALSRVPGFDFMVEYQTEEPPDDRFAEIDKRKGKEGQVRRDKNVDGRFYLAMPDVTALGQLVSLWERWSRGERLERGFAPFEQVFAQLRTLRPWGAADRIPSDTIDYWQEELARSPGRPVRTEVELWFYRTDARRQRSSRAIRDIVGAAGGAVLDETVIEPISYHGMLIDIPADALPALIDRREVTLALADDVMFLRPQSLLRSPLEIESVAGEGLDGLGQPPAAVMPVAALLDGVPLQGHRLLADRLRLDDPDDLQARAMASGRVHGTAMASLILHGDLNTPSAPLARPLYVRPLMVTTADGQQERTEDHRLLIDTIYRAVLRMKGSEGEAAAAPDVFLVNLSMADPRRPFTRHVSPLARLLDFLAARYNILFLVSAGNIRLPLTLNEFDNWSAFEGADARVRERAVLTALHNATHERSILSPAESLNALTIGAQHHDNVVLRGPAVNAVDPFDDHELPNVSSALGLGYRRTVKPDIYLPGGREHLRMKRAGGGVEVTFGGPQRVYGLSAACPDTAGRGRLDQTAFSDGTSSATALATRSAHRIFDALMDRDGGSAFADMPAEDYAIAAKALLIHRAKWSSKADLLKEICGPADNRQFVARLENASRFMGFGIPVVDDILDCAANRATLLAGC